jgi:hypothetical protein
MKNNLLDSIKLQSGTLVYDDFHINFLLPFDEQKWAFKEDLLQITFGDTYTIDVGWYPEFEPHGFFVISLIKDFNWQKPIMRKNCKKNSTLKKYLQDSINYVSKKRD